MTDKRREWLHVLLLIFLPALILRLTLALWLPADDTVFTDAPYKEYARNWAEGKGFWMGNPYGSELGIERVYAFRPPLFPFLWGCVYKLTRGAYAPIRAAHALLGALSCVLAWLIGREITPKRSAALLGGMLCAVYPPLIWHSVHLMTEPLFIFLGTLSIYTLLRFRRNGRGSWLIAAGVAAGLCTLSRSVMAGFLPFVALWLWWYGGRGRRAFLRVAVFAVVVSGVMAPWIIRNAVVLRAFVPTTTDMGHGFYVANNPRALEDPAGFNTPDDWGFLLEPGERAVDEVTAARRLVRLTARTLCRNPGMAIRLMFRRFVIFWRFYPNPRFIEERLKILVYACAYVPLFLFMVPGAWLIHRKAGERLPGLVLIDLLVLYTTGIHVAILAMLRYRVPLMPFLLMFSATAIVACLEKMRRKREVRTEN